MSLRYLCGPVSATEHNLTQLRGKAGCLTFDSTGPTDLAITPSDCWETIVGRLPEGWFPDCIVLQLAYTTIPAALWSAPVPLIGVAGDWNLLWHQYRYQVPCCDAVFTDAPGVAALEREGHQHVLPANLYGCASPLLQKMPTAAARDIDVLFVGNLHPAVQRERLSWLGRLAELGQRWRVVIRSGVWAEDYHNLLARSRILFNRSIRGECNLRTFEAAAAGALLFQEIGNHEVPAYWRDRQECVYYDSSNFETLLEHYLEHEEERQAIAEAARRLVPEYRFDTLWDKALERLESVWEDVQRRAERRRSAAAAPSADASGRADERAEQPPGLVGRCWQALGSARNGEPELAADLARVVGLRADAAGRNHNLLGLVVARASCGPKTSFSASAEIAAAHFRKATEAAPNHILARLNLAEALGAAGQMAEAIGQARRALESLDHLNSCTHQGQCTPHAPREDALTRSVRSTFPRASSYLALTEIEGLDEGHFPTEFDHFRVEWERAAWLHSGDSEAEARAKRTLLRWRLHLILAELTDDISHRYEAAIARPDIPLTRASLGCALARAGRFRAALEHLQFAVEANPFDVAAARALYSVLGEVRDQRGQRALVRRRRLLSQAAPQVIPAEPWFAGETTAPGTAAVASPCNTESLASTNSASAVACSPASVSLCMIVKDEENNLPAGLASVQDLVSEVIVVDTGSRDGTREVARRHGAKVFDFPWCDDFSAARNESIARATGDWILWLDADDRVDEDNRNRLRSLFAQLRRENAAYVMHCLCLPDPDSGTATLVQHVRLFSRHPQVRWQHRVHEQILPAIRRLGAEVRWTEVVINHVGYQDKSLRRRKLERDLRLLTLESAEMPDHPFTLFNLGSIYLELGKPQEALPVLQRSLDRSQPGDSIVRKLYALIATCWRHLGKWDEALAACRAGRVYYNEDKELLFDEALLLRQLGDLKGAEACLTLLLENRDRPHFASIDTGLAGYKGRHSLAVVLSEQGRHTEAEAHWREALSERPAYVPSLIALANHFLKVGRLKEVQQLASRLESTPARAEAQRLRASAQT